MDVFAAFADGFTNLAGWWSLTLLAIGTLIGLVFGVMPGLGGSAAIALLTPLTISMSPFEAIILMAGVMASTATSGAVTAILINTPGTAPNAATVLDGYPLAKQGRAGYAIGAAAASSGIGGLLGIGFLICVIPITREIVLAFGPPEFFLMSAVGLCAVAVSTEGKFLRGLIVACFGLAVATIGFDDVSGETRYAFGSMYLWDGVKLVPAMIGLFAVAEMINLWAKGGSVAEDPSNTKIDVRQVLEGVREAVRRWPVVLRGSAIGAGVGALPGVGGTVAAFLAYTVAAQSDRNRENFGKGEIAGVIAPESANNAKEGGALIPTLAFGIPGSAEMAVFLGVLVLHGLAPGPTIMTQHMDVVWTLILATVVSGVFGTLVTLFAASNIARLTLIDSRTLAPIVMSFALIGSYSLNNEIMDVGLTIVFGLVGYAFMRLGYPRLTFPIALVLGPIMETSYFQSMIIGDGSHLVFVSSWPSRILFALLILAAVFPAVRYMMKTRGRRRPAPAE